MAPIYSKHALESEAEVKVKTETKVEANKEKEEADSIYISDTELEVEEDLDVDMEGEAVSMDRYFDSRSQSNVNFTPVKLETNSELKTITLEDLLKTPEGFDENVESPFEDYFPGADPLGLFSSPIESPVEDFGDWEDAWEEMYSEKPQNTQEYKRKVQKRRLQYESYPMPKRRKSF